jgi:hypothetical protein
LDWPPGADAFYLGASHARPIFQGDIFRDVPFVKAKGGASRAVDPDTDIERRHVATFLHPCEMYTDGGRVLNRVQVVALVKKAQGITIPEDWGGAFSVCPLPDLAGDGSMWIADMTRLANIDRSFLTSENRERSLSELGWSVFRQRLALACTRVMISLTGLERIGKVTWQEALLATVWGETGRDAPRFHDWLDEPDPDLGGLIRRNALERGMYEEVHGALARELE